jgi:hypothetical protein
MLWRRGRSLASQRFLKGRTYMIGRHIAKHGHALPHGPLSFQSSPERTNQGRSSQLEIDTTHKPVAPVNGRRMRLQDGARPAGPLPTPNRQDRSPLLSDRHHLLRPKDDRWNSALRTEGARCGTRSCSPKCCCPLASPGPHGIRQDEDEAAAAPCGRARGPPERGHRREA